MADVTPILINQLASQTTLQDTDYFIVGGDDAKKITVAQMKEALGINSLNMNKIAKGDLIVRQVSGTVSQSNGYGARQISLSYSGYKALGVVGYSVSSTYHAVYQMNFNSSAQTVTVGIRHVNDTSSSGNANVYLQVLYVKS